MNIPIFPTINSLLNLTAFIFLLLGYMAIKNNKPDQHKKMMIAAVISSTLFLCSYLTYHYLFPGVTKYQKEGFSKILYFAILLTHTPLAALIVPFIIAAIYFAYKGNFATHKKITKWLYPVWVYVSVTGVIIYLMLYVFGGRNSGI